MAAQPTAQDLAAWTAPPAMQGAAVVPCVSKEHQALWHSHLLPERLTASPTSSASQTWAHFPHAHPGVHTCASSGDEREEFFSDPSLVPAWLCRLLKTTYFQPCPHHRHLRKSDTLFYCLHCQTPPPGMCQHCKAHHDAEHAHSHSVLQIRRYVYQDVARTADLRPFFCPTHIQQYTINGAEVVFLRPRPSGKVPDKQDERSEPCWTCGRHCRSPMHFCSLACKVQSMIQRKGRVQGALPPEGWSLPVCPMAPPTPPRPMRPVRTKMGARHLMPAQLQVAAPAHVVQHHLVQQPGLQVLPGLVVRAHRRKQTSPRCAPY